MYPCKYMKSSKIKKHISSIINKLKFDDISINIFSPTKLYMKGWITVEEYKNISKYNVVKLRIYHTSYAPLFIRVLFRMLSRTVFGFLRRVLID